MKEFIVSRHPSASRAEDQPRRARLRIDDSWLVTWADAGAESMFGYDGDQFFGMTLRKLVATREDDPQAPAHEEALGRGDALTLTFRHETGYFFTGELALGASHVDADNAATASIKPLPDAPVDMRLLRQVEESGQLGIWELTVCSNTFCWSDGTYRILDLRPGQDVDPEHVLFYFQDGQPRVRAALRRCLQRGKAFTLELPVLTARQRRRWVRLSGRAQRQGNQVQKITGALRDITAEREQSATTQRWQQLLRGVLGATDDLIVAVDRDLRVMVLNDAYADQFEATFGIRPGVGDSLTELLKHCPNERRLYQRLWERALERESFCVEMPLAQRDRELPIFEVHYRRLCNADGTVLGAAHVAHDMSSRLRVSDNLNYLSTHDPMTGLLNRREFLQRLKRALRNGGENSSPHALLYLDIDDFGGLNEVHGPGACDRYLRELATLLTTRVRQRDFLARVGGDKFAVLFDNCNEAEARKVAETLRSVIDDFTFEWHDKPMNAHASGGLVPLTAESEGRPEDILALAADLCQTAKNAGRARLHVHRDQAIAIAETEARAKLAELQAAIKGDRIELRFQTIRPIASATWGDHVEVLSQLELGDNASLREPADFLPIAERFDLACLFDRLVVGKTLAWLNQHPIMEARLKLCSFNLSMASLLDPAFPAAIGELLGTTAFAPGVFCFEVKESDAARHPDAVVTLCDALHELGCKVALDGVGGAAQSFTLISRLPVDVIKLDGRLMKALAADPVQQVLVEALQKVAEVSGKVTIAQYIEDDEMLKQARQLGIHFGQGFRLSLPKPLAELAPPGFNINGRTAE